MEGRRRRPEPPRRGAVRPRGTAHRARGTPRFVDPATLVAWLLLLAGVAAFAAVALRPAAARTEPVAVGPPRAAPASAPVAPSPARPALAAAGGGARTPPAPARTTAAPAPPARPEPARLIGPPALAAASARRPGPVDDLLALPASGREQPRRARIAIIIDDVGRDLGAVRRALALPGRLTLSIIPYLPHSREAAALAHQRGFEVMLHLPMEPLDYPREDPGRGAVLMGMRADEIRRTVLQSLAAVPHVRGLNNHMGSRLTADRRQMRSVLEALSATPYFFIDSRTSEASVAYNLARELRIPTAERAVFLDDERDGGAVKTQLRRLEQLARERGSAIAIGHPHAVTLEALRDELPRLDRAGFQLVFASELVS